VRVLAIDQGTSATKAVVFDDALGIVCEIDVPLTGQRFDGDAVEQDPLLLWDSVVRAGREALAAAGAAVDCVGVGNQGETVLGWRRSTGEPVTTAVVWQDGRSAAVTHRLRDHSDELQQISGLPLDPYFAGPKIAWVAENLLTAEQQVDPDIVVTTIDAWVLHRLCGQYVTDASTASRTMLLDLEELAWSGRAADFFGIDLSRQPRVVACDDTLGITEAFGPRLPVTGIIVDQQAALYAQGCLTAGEAKCTFGTGAFLLTNLGPTPTRSKQGLSTSVAWMLRDGVTTYCADGQVFTVGAAISWLERIGLIASPNDIDRLGLSVADSGGVAFIPSLAGVGAPYWDSGARGAFTGLSLSSGSEQLVRAVGEGIAAQVALLVRSIETDLGRPLQSLRVDGGITQSTLIMQRQADLLGTSVEVYPFTCATALGVAAMALRGHFGAGAEQVVVNGWRATQVFEPAVSDDERHALLADWESALNATLATSRTTPTLGSPS